jgi:hypothetical protein
MKDTWIIGVRLNNRLTDVKPMQALLTKFGCSIKTRLGLHDIHEDDPNSGIIILELRGDPQEFVKLEFELKKLTGAEVQKMVFTEQS